MTGFAGPTTWAVSHCRKSSDSACTDAEFGGGGWSYDEAANEISLTGDCTAYVTDLVEVVYEEAGVAVN